MKHSISTKEIAQQKRLVSEPKPAQNHRTYPENQPVINGVVADTYLLWRCTCGSPNKSYLSSHLELKRKRRWWCPQCRFYFFVTV